MGTTPRMNGQVLLQLATEKPDEVRGWLPGGEPFSDLMALLHVWLDLILTCGCSFASPAIYR